MLSVLATDLFQEIKTAASRHTNIGKNDITRTPVEKFEGTGVAVRFECLGTLKTELFAYKIAYLCFIINHKYAHTLQQLHADFPQARSR